jgi:hypothetical protein
VGLRIDDLHAKPAKNREFQTGIRQGPTDFENHVGIGRRGHEIIAAPALYCRIEIVVRTIGPAIEDSLIDNGFKAFTARIRDKNLLRGADL